MWGSSYCVYVSFVLFIFQVQWTSFGSLSLICAALFNFIASRDFIPVLALDSTLLHCTSWCFVKLDPAFGLFLTFVKELWLCDQSWGETVWLTGCSNPQTKQDFVSAYVLCDLHESLHRLQIWVRWMRVRFCGQNVNTGFLNHCVNCKAEGLVSCGNVLWIQWSFYVLWLV